MLHNLKVVHAVDMSWNTTHHAKDPILRLVSHVNCEEDYEEIEKRKLHIRVEAIDLTRGVLAVMSHIRIWEEIVKGDDIKGEKYFVVLEDDAYVTHDFDVKFQRYISEVPDKFDIIYSALNIMWSMQVYIVKIVITKTNVAACERVLNDHYGTFGYIVSYSGQKLLANVYPLTQQIDSYNFSYEALEVQRRHWRSDVYMFFPTCLRAKSLQINCAAIFVTPAPLEWQTRALLPLAFRWKTNK